MLHGNHPGNRRRQALVLALALAAVLLPGTARGGGGPENVFLLVNSRSEASKTIANYYIQLRHIPASNVLYLDWTDDIEQISGDVFRNKILQPALEAMTRRGLTEQIDYLVYSSDFPWQVNLTDDFGSNQPPAQMSPRASLNGATYLWRFVAAKDRNSVGLQSNLYVQRPDTQTKTTVSHGFRSWYGWLPHGKLRESGGQSYLLSTMLGVTSGRGNSTDEVIRYLQRSAKADGTRPKGTVYLMKNGNVRLTTRDWAFESAADELRKLGVGTEILDGTIPQRKVDVLGVVVGTSDFDWKASASLIQPGAICEHLTSMGGVMRQGAGQTPLSEFLRYGASGASGTVTEPYAIQDKFPLAQIHVHYARGCTLAEAFYQAVGGPYQLLIVGDPLCRPWAIIPSITASGVSPNQTLSGTVQIRPQAQVAVGATVERFELFVDGRRTAACADGDEFTLDTKAFADGYHELRVVGIESSDIESQGRVIVPVVIDNGGGATKIMTSGNGKITDDKLKLTVSSDGASAIIVHHNGHAIGRVAGASGNVEIAAKDLGSGPVTLQAIAIGGQQIASKPLELVIDKGN